MGEQMNLNATQDFFAYVTAYIDGFPEEDRMTPERAIDELVNSVESALLKCNNKYMDHWLTLSQSELEQVRSCLRAGQSSGIEKHLQAAREYFDSAVQERKMIANFTVNLNGQASVSSDHAPES